MDFFTHQDRARRNTFLLVIYYIIAVFLIIMAVYGAFALVFLGEKAGLGTYNLKWDKLWHGELFLCAISGTLLVVISGTAYKILQLASSGGSAVANILGGSQISQVTLDLDEKKVLNVVEEMAIASGLPVPPVFVLEKEMSVNAFAAGFSHQDAVIGVTRGCISRLNRDELQGVIAHEFSHILNGDMRLNIKLIGILNGILVIAIIGYWIMRLTSSSSSSSSSKGKKGSNPLPILGLLLMIVGYIGVFFGNLIKAAVSRQREFLADASAVQFTRNPSGISDALKKIEKGSYGSVIGSPKAHEASHMFFANGMSGFFAGLFKTHPPLKERIKRIDDSYVEELKTIESYHSVASPYSVGFSEEIQPPAKFKIRPEEIISRIGTPTSGHVAYASIICSKIPPVLLSIAKNESGAMAVIYAMLIDDNTEVRETQISMLKENIEISVFNETLQILPIVSKMWQGLRLPLIDLTIPSLKMMSEKQYDTFIKTIEFLVSSDNRVKLFEYTVTKIIRRNLDIIFGRAKLSLPQYKSIKTLIPKCEDLLSLLAYSSTCNIENAKRAFDRGAERLGAVMKIRSPDDCNGKLLDSVLSELALAVSPVKRMIIEACVACITTDNEITIEEAELLRAVAVTLYCPIPPFLPGKN